MSEAYRIDRETGTNHWTRAIEKEMKNVRIAFEKIDGVDEVQMRTDKSQTWIYFLLYPHDL